MIDYRGLLIWFPYKFTTAVTTKVRNRTILKQKCVKVRKILTLHFLKVFHSVFRWSRLLPFSFYLWLPPMASQSMVSLFRHFLLISYITLSVVQNHYYNLIIIKEPQNKFLYHCILARLCVHYFDSNNAGEGRRRIYCLFIIFSELFFVVQNSFWYFSNDKQFWIGKPFLCGLILCVLRFRLFLNEANLMKGATCLIPTSSTSIMIYQFFL